ncbi:MAG TPA: conserved phage C-terminal domain-containing protein [Thermophilibacter provencensis]|uniref:Conserved phage C-terminal domain-containing protein n=2 Tax=Thermophilibacter provencensis TaxID=1852386 RepID=A0A921KLX6_9ACTN|nr:conserved phage C-terminal domain-containing protein [Thermophilibacter provencensis]HJF45820.1 conserved phage C-terminal domain-containing protein [Thermophilibacter provencensis]
MALAMVRPVLDKSRKRIVAGSEGGSKSVSKAASKRQSKRQSKQESKTQSEPESEEESNYASKKASDIYSSSSLPLPDSPSEEEGCGEEDGAIPYAEIVASLNEAAGTSYRPTSKKTRQLIHARWAEGFRLPDFEAVIGTMSAAWLDDPKMAAYLRPETLFGTKFESYLNRPRPRKGARDGDPFAAY